MFCRRVFQAGYTLYKPYLYTFNVYHYSNYIKMQNAYLRYHDGADVFQLTFRYQNKSFNVDRQFNFSRQISESVNDLLSRIVTNVNKVINKKKKKNKCEKDEIVEVQLMQKDASVSPDKLCKDIISYGNLSLNVCGTVYEVIVNSPTVDVMSLPTSIMVGFPVYPNKFEISFAKVTDCIFVWYVNTKSELNGNSQEAWQEVGTGFFYVPTVDHIGHNLKLKCIPANGVNQGLSVEFVSSTVVEAGPGLCPFEQRHSFTQDRLPVKSFRVVSYNILADLYADSETARTELFPYCPPYALAIDYRKQLVVKELLGYNADVYCLQEVDSKVFDKDLLPVLSTLGYEGVFNMKGGTVREGLACLFHPSKFKLTEAHTFVFAKELQTNQIFSTIWEKIQINDKFASRFTNRTTSLQIVVLESTEDSRDIIVVGNTHLYFHPNADHVRLLQGGMAIHLMQNVVQTISEQKPEKNISVLLCGDFNSTPECGVFKLMTTQHVPEDSKDWSSCSEEKVEKLTLSHSLQLASACGTPPFTNYTAGFAGCLDYIFYQQDHLQVTEVVPLPSTEEMSQYTALPSVVFPSDHIALVASLQFV